MLLVKRRELLWVALGLPAVSVGAHAEAGQHYSARLISGETQQKVWRAGLDVVLDQGWKTYWRVPGESGVPPQFDWSRSRNVESVKMHWPVPSRITDAGGETIGYEKRVIFLFDVAAADPGRPVDLALEAFLGVCEKICIPVKLEMSLRQASPTPADASLLAAFAARVPRKVDAGSPFRATRARLIETNGSFDLALHLAGEGFDKDFDVFVEGSEFAYFREPRPSNEKGLVLLHIDGVKDAQELKGHPLTLTMTAGDIRLEQEVTVD
jgi:DsbC/DsbD-like thiol-disulfide interchange protein